MVTMSSILEAGTTVTSQGGKGKRNWAGLVGLIATVALGLNLVVADLLGHGRQAEQRTAPQMSAAAPAEMLSGGSYADLVWELEQATRAATYNNTPATQAGTLSGGSYADLVWELEQAAR